MSVQQKFYWLIGGVIVLLGIATAVGALLKMRVTSDSGRAVVDNLNQRTRAWWSMVAIFVLAFFIGKNATLVLFGLISFLALRHLVGLYQHGPHGHL